MNPSVNCWILTTTSLKSTFPPPLLGASTKDGRVEYRVELDVFNGPLDLLLYLIKRDELDIYDIPISRITETYMQYVTMLREMSKENGLDINVAGDFMVMAATLMEIKSSTLLPSQPVTQASGTTAAQ